METYSKNLTPEMALQLVDHIPVANLRKEIRQELREHPNFVLIGETGSGKTTCLGPLLIELRDELKLKGKVGVTQPRRIATTSVTDRVSSMMGTEVGGRIGYHIRFDDNTSKETDLTFMTDGILLKKIQYDPLLREFSIIMIDEAHERSLNIDLCMGLLKMVNESRASVGIPPVRIVVSSATIDRNLFSRYIGYEDRDNSVEIRGQMFPVQVTYENDDKPNKDYTLAAAKKVRQILESNSPGDILIFMPGKTEINQTVENIYAQVGYSDIEIVKLHSELSPDEQNKAFMPSQKRKIIVSTNIAETSVTIDGIIHVIDSGLVKQNQFDPRTGIEQLVLVEHAISGINQRAGRAGRTAPGFCHRLFSEKSLRRRQQYQTSEIQRSNLSQVVLAMKKAGINDVERFDFIERPDPEAIDYAIDQLTRLGALDDYGDITEIGEFMVELSIEPKLARMIIEATDPNSNCLNEICILASFLDGKSVFARPSDPALAQKADSLHAQFKKNKESDFVTILNVWQAYIRSGYSERWAKANYLNEKVLEEAYLVREELLDVLSRRGINIDSRTKPKINVDAIGRAIASGLVDGILRKTNKGFKKLDNTMSEIFIHPSSVVDRAYFRDGDYIVSADIFMDAYGKTYASSCMYLKQEWVRDIIPNSNRSSKKNRKQNHKKTYNVYKNSKRNRW